MSEKENAALADTGTTLENPTYRAGYSVGPFHTHAEKLLLMGYRPIPIVPGEKTPALRNWVQFDPTRDTVRKMATNGFAGHGVGLLTGKAGATGVAILGVDIDTRHEALSRSVSDWCRTHIGLGVERVGKAPKSLLVYRGPVGLAKVTSPLFFSPGHIGDKAYSHRLEILGDGQQFVLMGIHPDTGKPYEHGDFFDRTLDQIDPAHLTEITPEQIQDLVRFFAAEALRLGLIPRGDPNNLPIPQVGLTTGAQADLEDLSFLNKTGMSLEEATNLLRAYRKHVPDAVDDRDTWIRVGMALHFEGDGEEDWFQLWHAWGRLSAKNRGEGPDRYTWNSFGKSGHTPVTLRSLLAEVRKVAPPEEQATVAAAEAKIADSEARIAEDARAAWVVKLAAATDLVSVQDLARQIGADTRLTPLARGLLETDVVQALTRTSGGRKVSVSTARGLITPPAAEEARGRPDWLKPWVFVVETGEFYNLETKQSVTATSFNGMYDREVMDMEMRAHIFATTHGDIPCVAGLRYRPQAARLFTENGQQYANLFRDQDVPDAKPEALWTPEERETVSLLEGHMAMSFPDQEARRAFMNWLAHNVQKPGIKIRWAPLIKGIQGDGKTLFRELLAACLGPSAVGGVDNTTMTSSQFSDWADGRAVVALEEVYYQGHNRFEVLNKLKPMITNTHVEIHPKGKPAYSALSVANYIAFTNHTDAFPMDEHDRRWLILFTPWNNMQELTDGVQKRTGMSLSDYFTRLFDNGIYRHREAIRGWFMAWDLSTFNPNDRPIWTAHKATMVADTRDWNEDMVRAVIERGAVGVTKTVIAIGHLASELKRLDPDYNMPTQRLGRLLVWMGYRNLGVQRWGERVLRVYALPGAGDWSHLKGLLDQSQAPDDFFS